MVVSPLIGVFASTVGSRAEHPPLAIEMPTAVAEPATREVTAPPAPANRSGEASAAPVTAPAARAPAPPPPPTQAPPPPTPTPAPPPSLFQNAQIIAFYGSPISPLLGVLGRFAPADLVRWLKGEAGIYDSINGDRGAVPALDLIYAQAQSDPTDNGLYLRYLSDEQVRWYIALAEQNDLQVILDLQIGRGDVLGEVQKIEPYLENPRVHVAIDPEYAVGPQGVPIETPGTISGEQINAVQQYLDDLVRRLNLPPKLLVIHQYMDQTVTDGGAARRFDHVDLVLNMDAYGAAQDKVDKYHLFAARSYAQRRSFNVFLQHDDPVASENDVMRLSPQPDMVIYQ